MEKKIVLKSTQKGFLSDYIWALLWFVAFWFLASWAAELRETIDRYDVPWPHIVMWVAYLIMGIIALFSIHTLFYGSREVNTFFQNEEGFWNKLICDSYDFPFSKNTDQVIFDRIIKIEVSQESISRILNTGNLKVKLITFTNADSQETRCFIPGIKNPFERKIELEEALLAHEGLKINFNKKSESESD